MRKATQGAAERDQLLALAARGPARSSSSARGGHALERAGAPGFFAVAGWLDDPGTGGQGNDPSAGRSASASTPVLETIAAPRFGSTSFLARGVDVGADAPQT
jgi:hypothetical protein